MDYIRCRGMRKKTFSQKGLLFKENCVILKELLMDK